MKVCRAVFLVLCFGALCLPAAAGAQVVTSDPDLPQPFDAAALLPMLKNPPFNRVVDYTDSLLLTGVAYVEGKPMATLLDKNTQKRYVVSEVPDAQGWRLAEASVSNELQGTEIKLQVGEEIVTFRYSPAQLSPGKTGTPTAAAGTAGQSQGKTAAYLSAADQAYYRNGMSKEARERFGNTMNKVQGKMDKMTEDQKAAYSQKLFNKIKAQDQSGGPPAGTPKKAKK